MGEVVQSSKDIITDVLIFLKRNSLKKKKNISLIFEVLTAAPRPSV